jgi:Tol biopolymer transport system component
MHASSPEWTNNGRIFFSSRPDGAGQGPASNASHHTPPDFYVMNASGSGLQHIPISNEFPSGPQTIYWDSSTPVKVSPDGKHVAFSTIQDVLIQNRKLVRGYWIMLLGDIVLVDGHLQVRNMRKLNAPSPFWYEAKGFTHDGTQLLFASTRGNGQGNSTVNPDVYTMNLASGAITRYTHNPAWEETMDIPPSKQFVVFNSDRANLSLGPSQIAPSHNNTSSFLQVLTAKTAHHDLYLSSPQGDAGWTCHLTFYGNPDQGGWAATQPRWSPNGQSIRFQETKMKSSATLLLTFSHLPATFP